MSFDLLFKIKILQNQMIFYRKDKKVTKRVGYTVFYGYMLVYKYMFRCICLRASKKFTENIYYGKSYVDFQFIATK